MQEVDIRLTVLHAEFTLSTLALQREGVVVNAHFLQYDGEDFRNGFELEDAAVLAQ